MAQGIAGSVNIAVNFPQNIATQNLRKTLGNLQSFGSISGDITQFNRSMDAATARVLAFGASASVLYAFQRTLRETVSAIVNVEKSLTDINVIFNASDKNLTKFGTDLFNIAKSTGQSFASVAKSAVELSRQGLGMEETLKRAKAAMILVRMTGMEADDAIQSLTATINSFSNEIVDATALVNKMAAVDAAFAVSSEDLVEGIKRAGSVAQSAGVNLSQLIGIITSLQQTTARGGAIIGNAFKTIFTRIQDTKVLEQLNNMGIAVRDINDETLPAMTILDNLANAMKGMGRESQNQAARLVANLYQINQLRAAMDDLAKKNSIAAQASRIFSEATNEAEIRNERLNKTLAAQFNRLKVNLTQVGAKAGEGILSPTLQGITGLLNNILEGSISRDSKNMGELMGKGIVSGLGDFLSGPGSMILLFLFAKMAGKFAKQAYGALQAGLGGMPNVMSFSGTPTSPGFASTIPYLLQSAILPTKGSTTLSGQNIPGGLRPLVPRMMSVGSFSNIPGGLLQTGGIAQVNAAMARVMQSNLLLTNPGSAYSYVLQTARQYGANTQDERDIRRIMGLQKAESQRFQTDVSRLTALPGLVGQAGGIFAGGAARQQILGLPTGFPGRQQAIDEFRAVRLSRMGTAAFALSPLAQMAPQLFTTPGMTREQRIKNASLSALGDIVGTGLTGAWMGALLGKSPYAALGGAAVGVGIGGYSGYQRVSGQAGTVMPELERAAKEAADSLQRLTEQLGQLSNIAEKIEGMKGGTIPKTGGNILGIVSAAMPILTKYPALQAKELIDLMISGGGGLEEKIGELTTPLTRQSSISNFLRNFGQFTETGAGGESLYTQLLTLPGAMNRLQDKQGQKLLGQLKYTPSKFHTTGNEPANYGPMAEFIAYLAEAPESINNLQIQINKGAKEQEKAMSLLAEAFTSGAKTIDEVVDYFGKKMKEIVEPGKEQAFLPAVERLRNLRQIQIGLERGETKGLDTILAFERDLATAQAEGEITMIREGLKLQAPEELIRKQADIEKGMQFISTQQTISGIKSKDRLQSYDFLKTIVESLPNNKQQDPIIKQMIRNMSGLIEQENPDVFEYSNAIRNIPEMLFQEGGQFQGKLSKEQISNIIGQWLNSLTANSRLIVEANIKYSDYVDQLEGVTKAKAEEASYWGQAKKYIDSFYISLAADTERLRQLEEEGLLFSPERAEARMDIKLRRIAARDLYGRDVLTEAGGTFTDQFQFGVKDLYKELIIGAAELGSTMKSSFKDAFKSFVDGTNDAKGALQSLGLAIFDKLLDKSIGASFDLLFGGITAAGKSMFGKGMASGGLVYGGSGTRDDIPMMLNTGDYVIRRSSVNKFGTSFLNSLNMQSGGSVNIRLRNAFLYDNESRPTSGRFDVSPYLSAFGQTDEDNPQNILKFQREQALYSYIAEQASYEQAKQQAIADFERAKSQRLIGAAISVGAGVAGAGLASGLKASSGYAPLNAPLKPSGTFPSTYGQRLIPPMNYATGGSVDNVPAMLTGGEFVVRRESVNKLGVPFLDSINRGQTPTFQTGGIVGVGPMTGRGGSSSSVSDLLSRLIVVNESIRETLAITKQGKNEQSPETLDSGIRNDISIIVNVDGQGRATEKVSTGSQAKNQNEVSKEQSKQFADQIKAAVLKIIIDQQRNGGLLSK